MSAVNVHETATVFRVRHGPQAMARLWQLLTDSEIEIVPFDETQVRAAAVAFDRYGKGIHPTARLNLADSAAYALAATMNAPLLFKGDDFAATDVRLVFDWKREAIKRRDHGEETLAEIGRSYNVSGWTISRLRA